MRRIRWNRWSFAAGVMAVVLAGPVSPCPAADDGREYISAVRAYADTVLRHARDNHGPQHTPLFVDGLRIDTHEPVRWRHQGDEWILSDLASQQNLLRTLDALATMTGDAAYRQAATEAIRFAFDHLRSPAGLLYWGGHCAYDAASERIVGEVHDKAHGGRYDHELERHYAQRQE